MVERISIHKRCFDARLRSIENWKVPEVVKTDLRRFIDALAIGKVNRGRRISESRLTKYLDLLVVPLTFLHKPTSRLNEKDVEAFEKALTNDVILSKLKARPYARATKADMRKALKVFLRWRIGPEKALKLAGWLDTRDHMKTPDFLSEHQILQLFRKCRTAEQRYVLAMLFDSGARAEEFINIRLSDIQMPEEKSNFVRVTLREEFSKTKGRTISLFWQHSLETVREFVEQRVQEGLRAEDPVFNATYDALRMFLQRLGKETLKRSRSVHPHLFRHSSATFYATKLNRQELCYRYGWRFSSNMPDIYISRAGMENKELDEKCPATELGQLKDELVKKEQADKIKDDRIRELETRFALLQDNFELIASTLQAGATPSDVESAIRRKHEQMRRYAVG